MSALVLLSVLLGAYLAAGLCLSAWRREADGRGDVGIWIAAAGAWLVAVLPRASRLAPAGALLAVGAWLLLVLLLLAGGAALGRRIPVRGFIWLLGPAHALLLALSWAAAARPGRRAVRGPGAREPSRGEGLPDGEEPAGEAVDNVVELGETTLDQVMVPRSEVRGLPAAATVAEWVARIAETGRTHLPLYGADLDEIRGYVCLKDLYRAGSPREPVTRFQREARIVPESMRADDLLRDLIAHNEKIAIVVDEFGGTAGLVRDHDLFEILLGEIERGQAAPRLRTLAPGVYLVEGQLKVDDFNETAAAGLPEGTYETLGGLFLARFGRIPVAGDRLQVEGATLEVVEATERRIVTLRITLPEAVAARGARGE